jgi:hypothetical protein
MNTRNRAASRGLLRRTGGRAARLASAVSVLFAAGCGDIFEVENPTNILDEDLADPQLVSALASTPEVAVVAAYGNAVVYGELAGDAVYHASSRLSNMQIDDGFFTGFNERYEFVYNELGSATWVADEALRRLREMLPNPDNDVRVANAYFWGGVVRITLADLFEEVTFDGGPPMTPAAAIRNGVDYFQKAAQISTAAKDANLAAAAYGALARAHRSLYFEELHESGRSDPALFGQAEAFALQALSARPDFLVLARYALPGSNNAVRDLSSGAFYDVMDPSYANLADPSSGQRDPRIKHSAQLGRGADGRALYNQEKYPDPSDDIPVSRWQEAELIIAEHRLMLGDVAGAVARIDAVRSAAGLPAFAGGDAAAVRAQLWYERQAEFWLELRRWQDHRYYGIAPEDWAPLSKEAGVHRRWPISERERDSNPNLRTGG